MKRKVMIISETTSGGVRKHLLDLLLNINKDKYEVYFLYSILRADETMISSIPKLKKNGIKLKELKNITREINPKREVKAFKEISTYIKEIRPDVVHCHSSKAGAIGRLAAKVNNVKSIYYTPHAYVMQNPEIKKSKSIFFKNIEKILSRCCTTKTINVSEGEKNFAVELKIDKKEKFEVIYNGLDSNVYDRNLNLTKESIDINQEDIIVGVVARLDDQKDPFTFINIAHKICDKYENVKFIYVGDGKYKDSIQAYINKNKLQGKIKLLGFRKDVDSILKIIDIYLITSLYEGLPYSLIEALKYKIPIIATNVIGNNEVVEHGYNGYLFEAKNIEDGFEKLRRCIENNDIENMKKNSYKLFKEKFELKKMIEKLERMYDY